MQPASQLCVQVQLPPRQCSCARNIHSFEEKQNLCRRHCGRSEACRRRCACRAAPTGPACQASCSFPSAPQWRSAKWGPLSLGQRAQHAIVMVKCMCPSGWGCNCSGCLTCQSSTHLLIACIHSLLADKTNPAILRAHLFGCSAN